MPDLIRALLRQATEGGSRSTALKPLGWLLAMLLPATLGAARWDAPDWLVILLAVLSCVGVLVYAGAYVYLLMKDPEALRSEKYSLQKLAIERGLFGDSEAGVFEPDRVIETPALSHSADDQEKT